MSHVVLDIFIIGVGGCLICCIILLLDHTCFELKIERLVTEVAATLLRLSQIMSIVHLSTDLDIRVQFVFMSAPSLSSSHLPPIWKALVAKSPPLDAHLDAFLVQK